MARLGDRLGLASLGKVLVGQQLPPESVPVPDIAAYDSFLGGLDTSDPGQAPLNVSIDCIDFEITNQDAIRAVPGFTVVHNLNPRTLGQAFVQPGLDYDNEIVAMYPPFLGVGTSPTAWTWTNVGFVYTSPYGWAHVTVLDKSLFSDGVIRSYTRAYGANAVTDISAQIIARSFAAAFGRVFAGGYVTGGAYQGLGIAWSASNGNIADWTGVGSGREFIVPNSEQPDQIVALCPIGQEHLGILCRNSLWVGVPTGQPSRPADFRQRFVGVGCVLRDTACQTPGGVTFLSDHGVVNFNANGWEIISGPINKDLLGELAGNFTGCKAIYQPSKQRYILRTPSSIWTYDFPLPGRPARWLKRSGPPHNMLLFRSGSVDAVADLYFVYNFELSIEDPASVVRADGVDISPSWRFPNQNRVNAAELRTYTAIEISYSTETADAIDRELRINLPNVYGDALIYTMSLQLAPSFNKITHARFEFPVLRVGQGTALAISLPAWDTRLVIHSVRLFHQAAGLGGNR